jgi:hypothetical protein
MLGMITINLLPAEMRRQERTPLTRFLALLVGIVVLGSTLAFYLYFHFSVLEYTRTDLSETQRELQEVQEQHKEYKALVDLKKRYEKRAETIRDIRYSRIPWAVKLMEFYDLFVMEDFEEVVWIDNLTMNITGAARSRGRSRERNAGPQPVGSFDFTINAKGDDFTSIIDFRRALRGDHGGVAEQEAGAEFWSDFLEMTPPGPRRVEDTRMEPPVFYKESIQVDIKEREAPGKKKPGRRG